MPGERYLDALEARTVTYRYRRRELHFSLSHALFASAGVDAGTHLLLALLAETERSSEYDRVVDVGCGTGTLGISLAAATGAPLFACDRDRLAVAFTARNAARNGVACDAVQTIVTPFPATDDGGRELVVCNVPAKAGEPVIRSLVARIVARAALSDGRAAFVVVRQLADLLSDVLSTTGGSTVAERRSSGHLAVVVAPAASDRGATNSRAEVEGDPAGTARVPDDATLPDSFVRESGTFPGPAGEYSAMTVWNLPEFDGLSFRTALAFDLLRGASISGPCLVVGAGQGHLAVGVAQRSQPDAEILIADRDLLSLLVTGENSARCRSEGGTRTVVGERIALPTLGALPGHDSGRLAGSLSWLVVNEDPVPGSIWNEELEETARALLRPDGKLLLVARSTAISRLEKAAPLREIDGRRMHGFRASLLRLRR